MTNRLYLVRHGENPANLTKEFSHWHIDYSLTPKGVVQSQQTAVYFADKNIHEIYSSPLKRAAETAEIIAQYLGLTVTVMEHFREINPGLLEMQPISAQNWAIHNQIIAAWFNGKPELSFPGGENYHALWERMRAGVSEIIAGKTGQNIIIVGHGGIFNLTLKDLCPEVDLAWLFSIETHNCAIGALDVELVAGEPRGELLSWGDHNHLHGEAAEFVSGVPKPGEL